MATAAAGEGSVTPWFGVKTYLVGGAVRDELLDLPVRERDWVVVGASVQQMLARGFRRLDDRFPVFRHPETGDEYALARRERKTAPGYKGFRVESGPDVTLDEDLRRRDLTINALARDEAGGLIDPFGGQRDLEAGLLRHVSPAFVEDPVRLLRTARFAARLGRWGFRVAHGTQALLRRITASGELGALRPERVWREMKLALAEEQPWRFFEVLHASGALALLMPGLDGVLAGTGGHAAKPSDDPMSPLRRAAAATTLPAVRFAVAMYPAARLEGGIGEISRTLRCERDYTEMLRLLLRLERAYSGATAGDPQQLWLFIETGGALRQPARFAQVLLACDALWPTGGGASCIEAAVARVRGVSASDPEFVGLTGKALGEAIRARRRALLRGAG